MSQNAMRLSWPREEVDAQLARNHAGYPPILPSIRPDGMTERISYVNGANVAGFVKVADAMIGQGVI